MIFIIYTLHHNNKGEIPQKKKKRKSDIALKLGILLIFHPRFQGLSPTPPRSEGGVGKRPWERGVLFQAMALFFCLRRFFKYPDKNSLDS